MIGNPNTLIVIGKDNLRTNRHSALPRQHTRGHPLGPILGIEMDSWLTSGRHLRAVTWLSQSHQEWPTCPYFCHLRIFACAVPSSQYWFPLPHPLPCNHKPDLFFKATLFHITSGRRASLRLCLSVTSSSSGFLIALYEWIAPIPYQAVSSLKTVAMSYSSHHLSHNLVDLHNKCSVNSCSIKKEKNEWFHSHFTHLVDDTCTPSQICDNPPNPGLW